MSGHAGCIRLKIKDSWRNRNGHHVQIWLTTGHSSCFFIKNVLFPGFGEVVVVFRFTVCWFAARRMRRAGPLEHGAEGT